MVNKEFFADKVDSLTFVNFSFATGIKLRLFPPKWLKKAGKKLVLDRKMELLATQPGTDAPARRLTVDLFEEVRLLQGPQGLAKGLQNLHFRRRYERDLTQFAIENFYSREQKTRTSKTNYSVWKFNNSLLDKKKSDQLFSKNVEGAFAEQIARSEQ